MQKAVEPENDAGFPKHNYSQLNCSCYSYPSPLSLDYSVFLGCTSMVSLSGYTLRATARVKARARTCTPRALVMYYAPIYIAYMR